MLIRLLLSSGKGVSIFMGGSRSLFSEHNIPDPKNCTARAHVRAQAVSYHGKSSEHAHESTGSEFFYGSVPRKKPKGVFATSKPGKIS